MQELKSEIFQMHFPHKLWYLLNLRTNAILWGGTGRTILLNYKILGTYLQCDHSIFKTTNISSFVRQLNLYGFRKVTSHLLDPMCNSSNPYMHEYIHEYFQYDKPELLNKITRKALAMKKRFRPKSLYTDVPQVKQSTPLQKARHALQVALKQAAQDLYNESANKIKINFGLQGATVDMQEENGQDVEEDRTPNDWMPLLQYNRTKPDSQPDPAPEIEANDTVQINVEENIDINELTTPSFNINYTDETSQQDNNETDFSGQFLNMPYMDSVNRGLENDSVELLAEFDIKHDIDDGIAKRIVDTKRDDQDTQSYLNCVLPSVNDQIDDVAMAERNIVSFGCYSGEWEQMFSDIISTKGSSQDSSTDMKELYSQISRTIDLLNS